MQSHIIYLNDYLNPRKGGPSGYLFSLYKSSENYNNNWCSFKTKGVSKSNLGKKGKYIILKKVIWRIFQKKFIKKLKNSFSPTYLERKEFNEIIADKKIKSIHFHSWIDLYKFTEFKNENIKVILTIHSPEAPFDEYIKNIKNLNYLSEKNIKIVYDLIESKVNKAIEKTDFFVFPCEQSLECYKSRWDFFEKNLINKTIYFFPTCSEPLLSNIDKIQLMKKYNIPKNNKIISFIGRHNYIKGYDILKECAKAVWKKNTNISFIVAGKEFPLKGIEDNRWIEVGWINNPGDIIKNSDLFILPNRETYFDLILLEVLSVGTPLIISNSGGNKYFKNKTNGIFLFEVNGIEECVSRITDILNMDKQYIEKIRKENTDCYNNNFNNKLFFGKYKKIIEKIQNRE